MMRDTNMTADELRQQLTELENALNALRGHL